MTSFFRNYNRLSTDNRFNCGMGAIQITQNLEVDHDKQNFFIDSIRISGQNCTENVDRCVGNSACGDNGQCVDELAEFSCLCNQGFTGDRCDTNYDICVHDNPCHNGAPCTTTNTNGGSSSGFVLRDFCCL